MISRAEKVLRKVFFKGGGGSSGDNYDAAYNARMANIAEQQQGMAQEYFNFWQSDYKPMEQAQISANMDMIPVETAYNTEKMQTEMGLMPKQAELAMGQMNSELSLLPTQTELSQQEMNDRMVAIGEKAPVRTAFFNEAMDGVDVESRANKAAADAAHAFMNSDSVMRRNTARMGVNPNSGRFDSMQNTNSINRAKAISGAKTTAREKAEQENFGRLQTAMGYGG